MRVALALLFLLVACGETRVRTNVDAGTTVCVPACDGLECGDDGCGGSCGTCPAAAPICTEGTCTIACAPNCAGSACGDDGCGGSCGTCPSAAPMCIANQCVATCTPSCAGRVCGDDGCGGTCGTCTAAQTCTAAGACLDPPACNPGERRCAGADDYERCGYEAATSTMRSFGPAIACGAGRTCSGGICGGGCVRPKILFVVDRSASMTGAAWIDVRRGVEDFVREHQTKMPLGLRMFPSGPGCTAGTIHAPRLDNAELVTNNLDTPTGDDETPHAAALFGLSSAFGAPADGHVVVLITDGADSCAADPTAARREAEVLLRAGVRTYVIGVGGIADPTALDAIAAAGDTIAHRAVGDGVAFAAALESILAALGPCGPVTGSGAVGDACTAAMDCAGDVCITDGLGFGRTFPNGYCSRDCSVMACPSGSTCVPDAFNSNEVCLKSCTDGAVCRMAYDCYDYMGDGICFPNP